MKGEYSLHDQLKSIKGKYDPIKNVKCNLITLLAKLSCDLAPIMAIYDFLETITPTSSKRFHLNWGQ